MTSRRSITSHLGSERNVKEQQFVGTVSGHYKVLRDVPLLIWPPEWSDECVALHATGKLPEKFPVRLVARKGEEFTVNFGERSVVATDVGDNCFTIVSIQLTIELGGAVHRGVTIAYNQSTPSIVSDPDAIKLIS